ncbi:Double-strand break repair protein mre11a [Blyttiomyces sp. JEL0837]|nr:Double-strand break repair protein mre11a [Blyttiomyces sp. JEL0837]
MMSHADDPDAADEDTIRILVATDNHLGYLEKDPVRSDDSFQSFEEILKIAKDRDVDFLLLGGDLFHDNKPSRKCLYKTMELLRRYCMGDKPIKFDLLSQSDTIFRDIFKTANYLDPNFNVSYPIFSIHGNHDDPSGDGDLCALDLLNVAGLVNYFGRQVEVDDVKIPPILLQKGATRLALYGLGNIRDERLHRTFLNKKVTMYRPKEDKDSWFNMMVLHQNRYKRGATNYIPESFLDDFLHLVIWGHEHECMIDLQENESHGFFVSQPGSSVATSLCEGEAEAKHVAILDILPDKQFRLEKIPLKTIRPFTISDIVLSSELGSRKTDEKRINELLIRKVEEMIEEAKSSSSFEGEFPKPLIRLRVEYSDSKTINPQRFGQQFVDKVANPKEILQFYRKRAATGTKDSMQIDAPTLLPEKLDKIQVHDLVQEYLTAQNLNILPENGIEEAVRLFVTKDDKDAITSFIGDVLKKTQDALSGNVDATDPDVLLEKIKTEKTHMADTFEPSIPVPTKPTAETAEASGSRKVPGRSAVSDDEDDDFAAVVRESQPFDEEIPVASSSSSRPKRKWTSQFARDEEEDDEDDEEVIAKPVAKSSRTSRTSTRGAKAATTKAAAPKRGQALKQTKLSFGNSSSRNEDPDNDDSFSKFSSTAWRK